MLLHILLEHSSTFQRLFLDKVQLCAAQLLNVQLRYFIQTFTLKYSEV